MCRSTSVCSAFKERGSRMSFFLEVFQSAFSPMVLFYMIAGVAAGICIGALPGLTATMGVALLLPLTFGMDATAGILMLLGSTADLFPRSFYIHLVHRPPLQPRLMDISFPNAVRQDVHSVSQHFPVMWAVLSAFSAYGSSARSLRSLH